MKVINRPLLLLNINRGGGTIFTDGCAIIITDLGQYSTCNDGFLQEQHASFQPSATEISLHRLEKRKMGVCRRTLVNHI